MQGMATESDDGGRDDDGERRRPVHNLCWLQGGSAQQPALDQQAAPQRPRHERRVGDRREQQDEDKEEATPTYELHLYTDGAWEGEQLDDNVRATGPMVAGWGVAEFAEAWDNENYTKEVSHIIHTHEHDMAQRTTPHLSTRRGVLIHVRCGQVVVDEEEHTRKDPYIGATVHTNNTVANSQPYTTRSPKRRHMHTRVGASPYTRTRYTRATWPPDAGYQDARATENW